MEQSDNISTWNEEGPFRISGQMAAKQKPTSVQVEFEEQ